MVTTTYQFREHKTMFNKSAMSVIYSFLICGLWFCGCSSGETARQYGLDNTNQTHRSEVGKLSIEESTTKIHPGDQIQISVWGYSEFNTTSQVKETGTIVIPLIGEIPAAGMSKDEFLVQVKKLLVDFVKGNPEVTVSVVSMNGMKVSVMGAITRQDNYPTMGEVSLVEILLSAGGATPEADLRHVMIFRNGLYENAINVDLPYHMQKGNITTVPKVRPGDTVFVPRQENLVRDLSGFMGDVLVVFGFFRILN